jgi:RsiW-degrading membrane proteinase PrsW (M82 family)
MTVILIALLPVTAFLILLLLFDSFKLVSTSLLIRALAAGAGAAVTAALIHRQLLAADAVSPLVLSRYVAPVTEETLKALFLIYPLRRRYIGFLVDAAIIGFAIGTGFALVENLEYLHDLPDRQVWLWVARGFGTALLHAMTTAIVAIAAKSLSDRFPSRGPLVLLPGLAVAIVLHSAFNHLLVSPLLSATLLLLFLPLIVLAVFGRSERATREWVGDGLDLDVELLNLVTSSFFGATRLGRYLEELKARFPGPVVADMFCLLQLDLELSIRAKGMLMAREQGLEVPVDDDLRARLDERGYLHRTIGPTGLLALRPLQVTNDRDDWLRYLLNEAGRRGA